MDIKFCLFVTLLSLKKYITKTTLKNINIINITLKTWYIHDCFMQILFNRKIISFSNVFQNIVQNIYVTHWNMRYFIKLHSYTRINFIVHNELNSNKFNISLYMFWGFWFILIIESLANMDYKLFSAKCALTTFFKNLSLKIKCAKSVTTAFLIKNTTL